jgi:hypothetical protein
MSGYLSGVLLRAFEPAHVLRPLVPALFSAPTPAAGRPLDPLIAEDDRPLAAAQSGGEAPRTEPARQPPFGQFSRMERVQPSASPTTHAVAGDDLIERRSDLADRARAVESSGTEPRRHTLQHEPTSVSARTRRTAQEPDLVAPEQPEASRLARLAGSESVKLPADAINQALEPAARSLASELSRMRMPRHEPAVGDDADRSTSDTAAQIRMLSEQIRQWRANDASIDSPGTAGERSLRSAPVAAREPFAISPTSPVRHDAMSAHLRSGLQIRVGTPPTPNAPEPVIEVTIGRIDVRAPARSDTVKPSSRTTSAPSLEDYLRRRSGRSRA